MGHEQDGLIAGMRNIRNGIILIIKIMTLCSLVQGTRCQRYRPGKYTTYALGIR
jgi:hypothetical protein